MTGDVMGPACEPVLSWQEVVLYAVLTATGGVVLVVALVLGFIWWLAR